ncbi:MAG: replication initiation protein [Rhodoferax sp.]|nr:replication initiation protein [Rhodoferax sp.]
MTKVKLQSSPKSWSIGEDNEFTMATRKTKIADGVTEDHSLMEFRKANEVIAPRVKRGGTFSLLSRKVFNVILYHSQRLGTPGANAPEGDPEFLRFYWVQLSELAHDAAYNSGDVAVLEDALDKLQDIKIIVDDSRGYAADVLIPNIRIIPARRGKPTMVGWTLDATTEKTLLRPELYTRLSIYYLTSLKTTAGISLYENAKRYATNPSGLTGREPWEWWHDVLTGLPIDNDKSEYKYFKRDVLNPAIAEVNLTDIRVILLETKNGRRITHLQFRIERVEQGALELPPQPVVDSKTIDRIRELGIHVREAEDLFASHDTHLVRATLDWVRDRMASKTLPRVESQAALFRSALRGRYAAQKSVAPKALPSPLQAEDPAKLMAAAELAARENLRDAARAYYAGLDDATQSALLAEFEAMNSGNPIVLRHLRKTRLESKLVESPFMLWLSGRLPAG